MENTPVTNISPKSTPQAKKNYKGPLRIQESKIILLRVLQGVPYRAIARELGRSLKTVNSVVKEHKEVLELAKDPQKYANARGSLITASEYKALKSVLNTSDSDFAKHPLSSRVSAFKTFFDARRMEEGLSTRNVAHSVSFSGLTLPDPNNSVDSSKDNSSLNPIEVQLLSDNSSE